MILSVALLSIAGFILSLYAYRLERMLASNPDYKPLCQLSDSASCTKPVLSGYGKIFGVSNGILGLLFYSMMAVAAFVGAKGFVFYGAVGACLASLFLAYLLFFRVRTFCVVCVAIYVVNCAMLIAAYMNYFGA